MLALTIVWYFIGVLAGLTLFLVGAEVFRDAASRLRRIERDADASSEDEIG